MATKTYARIADSAVVELVTLDASIDIAKAFHGDLVFVDVTGLAPPPAIGSSYTAPDIFVPPPPPDIAVRRADAKERVDAAAEAARLRFITGGSGQAMVYQAKGVEAEKYAAAVAAGGTPNAADYPLLSAEVGITAADLDGVAVVVNGMATVWTGAAAQIETIRLGAKRDIDAAADQATITAVVDGLAWPAPPA